MSKELSTSELFGHEKGSFTGAQNQKTGSLELANGGTVFLDEIANLSYTAQTSLLRVVQERKLRRVGGTRDIVLDIRIVAASNRQLWNETKLGRFREDLYHRFNEFNIDIPPLRERKTEIMTFANFFLNKSNIELEKQIKGFTAEVGLIFNYYGWPGNLRELKNVVKRAALLADSDIIDTKTLPSEIIDQAVFIFKSIEAEEKEMGGINEIMAREIMPVHIVTTQEMDLPPVLLAPDVANFIQPDRTFKAAGIDAEYEMIFKALKKANFNKSKTAKLLNIDRKTLYNKIKQYNNFSGPNH